MKCRTAPNGAINHNHNDKNDAKGSGFFVAKSIKMQQTNAGGMLPPNPFKHGNHNTDNAARTDHAPDDYLLNWTRENLPDAKDFWVSDADLIIRDRKNRLMIIEVKRHKGTMSHSQRTTYLILDALARQGHGTRLKLRDGRIMPFKYAGFFLLQFEKTGFNDGRAYIDGRVMSEKEIIDLFSLRKSKDEILNNRQRF